MDVVLELADLAVAICAVHEDVRRVELLGAADLAVDWVAIIIARGDVRDVVRPNGDICSVGIASQIVVR